MSSKWHKDISCILCSYTSDSFTFYVNKRREAFMCSRLQTRDLKVVNRLKVLQKSGWIKNVHHWERSESSWVLECMGQFLRRVKLVLIRCQTRFVIFQGTLTFDWKIKCYSMSRVSILVQGQKRQRFSEMKENGRNQKRQVPKQAQLLTLLMPGNVNFLNWFCWTQNLKFANEAWIRTRNL